MLTSAQGLKPRLIQLRRAIHRRPELGFEVDRTAELVARTLNELGIETRTGVGRTGVVGYLGDGDGPVIAIAPIWTPCPSWKPTAWTTLPRCPATCTPAATTPTIAMLLGAAMLLARRSLPGQVRLIFQPSEEAFGRGRRQRRPAHDRRRRARRRGPRDCPARRADLYTGTIAVETGQVNGADDTFLGHVRGRAGHGAHPHQALDAIWLATQVLQALYAVPARRVAPLQPAVLSLGIVNGGTASNIIPDSASTWKAPCAAWTPTSENNCSKKSAAASRSRAPWAATTTWSFSAAIPACTTTPAVVGRIPRPAAGRPAG